jgi:hypothetical protein
MTDAERVAEFGDFMGSSFSRQELNNPNRVTRHLVLQHVNETYWFARCNPGALRMEELPA